MARAGKTVLKEKNGSKSTWVKAQKVKKSKLKGERVIKGRRWRANENTRYAEFLMTNQKDFESEYLRRTTKVFTRLALEVENKTIKQCKSHHQKMMKKFDDKILQVIQYFLPMQQELTGMTGEETSTENRIICQDQSNDEIDSKISTRSTEYWNDDQSVGIYINYDFWDDPKRK